LSLGQDTSEACRRDLVFIGGVGAMSAGVFVIGALWQTHVDDPSLRGGIEMTTAVFLVFSAWLLGTSYRVTRSSNAYLGLLAGVAVAFVHLIDSVLPTFAGRPLETIAPAARWASSLLVLAALVVALARGRAGNRAVLRPVSPSCRSALFGLTLAAVAGVGLQLLLLPAVPTGWVSPAEAMRLIASGLLLTLAVRVNRTTQRSVVAAMLAAERLRIARDLHDGLAQDLAFISAHGERMARELDGEHPVAIAARRALAVSRGLAVDLAASGEGTAMHALRSVANEIESRYHVQIEVGSLDDGTRAGAQLAPDDRHEVVRIAREAMINAVTHGGARHVWVGLGAKVPGQLLLRVLDDGSGIDPSLSSSGLGMRTMKQRARQLNAQLFARRRRGGGTEIELHT
jgi:signal transduction histidine kinase